jgi:GNAT superfamily N-acetyltransferase
VPTGDSRCVEERARAWRHGAHRAVCDVHEPWAHGTVVRATRYPSYFDLNVVRVESATDMSVEALSAFADEALAGLAHRRVDFEVSRPAEQDVEILSGSTTFLDAADARRDEFVARGWSAVRLVWMRHSGAAPDGPDLAVEEVPYDAVHDLRVRWSGELDFAEPNAERYYPEAREVALARGAVVLAVREAGRLVAFAQLVRDGSGAEIAEVYVEPASRGCGRGTALTRAAIRAAGDVEDLWICADEDARAKDLYARLGFRPAWRVIELTLLP